MSETRKRQFLSEFIDLYKSLPMLWNTNEPRYCDRNIKTEAYSKLVEKFREFEPDATRDTVVKKINSLRTNFRKELTKIRQSDDSNSDIYKPTLWYFDQLLFLLDQKTPAESKSTQEVSGIGYEEYQFQEVKKEIQFDEPKLTKSPPKRKRSSTLKRPEERAPAALQFVSDSDEFHMMGKLYAEKLKKMNNLQCIYADRLIHEVLMEGQLDNLTKHSRFEVDANPPLILSDVRTLKDSHTS